MRHFREDITALPASAEQEPETFQRHLWRYPVRLELALAYLNITAEEHTTLYTAAFEDHELLTNVLGLPPQAMQRTDYFTVKAFLELTGLSYQQLLDLVQCGYVPIQIKASPKDGAGSKTVDLGNATIRFDVADSSKIPSTLRKTLVFIRLWRSLCTSRSASTEMSVLAEICRTLGLFRGEGTGPNPSSVWQLAALLMLREFFRVPLEKPTKAGTGSVLAIWTSPGPESPEWDRGVDVLLAKIQDYSARRFKCKPRGATFQKDLKDNLTVLSRMAGFTHTDPWYANPTSTIRFTEVLSKIHASELTVGELIFLFTTDEHAAGDDPFSLPDSLESICTPLNLPEDDRHNIWRLRDALLDVSPNEEAREKWTWEAIQSALAELGYDKQADIDALARLGEHFFPEALEACGCQIPPRARRFETSLTSADTIVSLWSADQNGPFRYDGGAQCLWTELPLYEDTLLEKLRTSRQLNQKEIAAVQDLYFAPRAMLVRFASIFEDFPAAVNRLIRESSGKARFDFFREQFALFHRRCEIIADHLVGHVSYATGTKGLGLHGRRAAWQLLRRISADEIRPSRGKTWESDSGAVPDTFTWPRGISSSAFGALLGLLGTGLLGKYEIGDQGSSSSTVVWRQLTSDLSFFGRDQDKSNIPIPTILPALNFEPSAKQTSVEVVNGFAIDREDERDLGGAQPFRVSWSGALLVETAGDYCFHVGNPREGDEEGPGFDGAKHQRWLVVLRRGQKSRIILNHCYEEAPAAPADISHSLLLQRGTWHIDISFEQRQHAGADHGHLHTGFQVKYKGPDTGNDLCLVPAGKLFQETKQETLGQGLNLTSSAATFLDSCYYSTLRDIRRTYQRVFKGLLLVSRLGLSTEPLHQDLPGESELSFVLRHPDSFLGTSYFRDGSGFHTHKAVFDLSLLPVSDPYHSPSPAEDARANPSPKRQAALFDCWERFHDYAQLRKWIRDTHNRHCWILFYKAAEQVPKADELLRYLGINSALAPAVLTYFKGPAAPFRVDAGDLIDERWAIRVWRAGVWLSELKRRHWTKTLEQALPWTWASDDPGTTSVEGTASGNGNLTRFVLDSHTQ